MPRSNTISLADAISGFIQDHGLRDQYLQTKVTSMWSSWVGSLISKHTTDLYLKDQVLHVYIDSAPLKHELTIAKSKLCDLINEKVDAQVVKDVIIR